MDFKQLQSYVTAVKYRSFSVAAEKLGISQPTISIHIKNIEEELGTKLVIRTAKSFEVTPKGQEFYDCVQNMIRLKGDLISRWSGRERKTICMGASSISSAYILPEVLPAFRNNNEDVYFEINQDDSKSIIEDVEKGKYDIGLVGLSEENDKLNFIDFYHDHMALITPVREKAKELNDMEEFPWEQILKYPWILRENEIICNNLVDKILQEYGYSKMDLCVIARMNDLEAVKNLVAGGVGISILPEKSVEDYRDEGKLLVFEIPKTSTRIPFYIVYKRDYILKPYVQSFIAFLKKYYENYTK